MVILNGNRRTGRLVHSFLVMSITLLDLGLRSRVHGAIQTPGDLDAADPRQRYPAQKRHNCVWHEL
jgi:hypothetical protein